MNNNYPEILEAVSEAVRLMHRKSYEQLARLPICELVVLERQTRRLENATASQTGHIVFGWLEELIEQMRPAGEPNLLDHDWRHYLILKNYYIDGRSVDITADILNLERARYHDLRRDALNALAALVFQAEKEALDEEKVLSNLGEQERRFANPYIPRFTSEGIEYVDALLDTMKRGRAWTIALTGGPGVGKTRIAFETGKRCVAERLFNVVVAIWIEDEALHYNQHTQNPYKRFAPITEVLNAIGSIMGRRDLRDKPIPQKREIIYTEMRERPTLLILDDLDYLDKSDWAQLSEFLERIPQPSIALLTSRLIPQVGERPFEVKGTKKAI